MDRVGVAASKVGQLGCLVFGLAFGLAVAGFLLWAMVEPWVRDPSGALGFYGALGVLTAVGLVLVLLWYRILGPFLQSAPSARIMTVGLALALIYDVREKVLRPVPPLSPFDALALGGWGLETALLVLVSWIPGFLVAAVAYLVAEVYVEGRLGDTMENWLDRNPSERREPKA